MMIMDSNTSRKLVFTCFVGTGRDEALCFDAVDFVPSVSSDGTDGVDDLSIVAGVTVVKRSWPLKSSSAICT